MRVTAYYRLQSPADRRAEAALRANIAAVRRWAQGIDGYLCVGDRAGALKQTRAVIAGLRALERRVAIGQAEAA